MKKIAFCFLIYDIINLEELWNIFFTNISKKKYNIYIHYKINVPLKYFEKYKLRENECIATQYANISLVCAQNILIKRALMDKENQYIIFLSNSCIPFKNFNHIYGKLYSNPKIETNSYFNISSQSQCFPRCNSLLEFYNREKIQKAAQWCILSRKHADVLITDESMYLNICKHIYAPDEICYITQLYYRDLEQELIVTNNAANTATTFINWQGMDYKYVSLSSLKNYICVEEEEIDYLLQSPCLFGRKFKRECLSSFFYLNYINKISTK
jgi:hypothetical protein